MNRSISLKDAMQDLRIAEDATRSSDPLEVLKGCQALQRLRYAIEFPEDALPGQGWTDVRSRIRQIQLAMSDALRALDARDIRGRITRALARLGPSTASEIALDVRTRIRQVEDARVAFFHALGSAAVLSWPDHHADYEIHDELRKMRQDGEVKRQFHLFRASHWLSA